MREFFLPMDSSNSTLVSGHWYRIDSDIALWNALKAHENKTITKRQAQAEKAFLISVDSIYPKFRTHPQENKPLPDGTPFRATWAQRWGDINFILSNPENIKRWEIEEPKIVAMEAAFLKELQQKELEEKEENRLAKQLEEKVKQNEIKRNQIILKPEIIPAVVAISSLIPLAIIGFLLINSRKGKK